MKITENTRVCEYCGKPMIEGFVLWGSTHACCEDCAIALYRGDRKAFEEDLALADSDESETYYTEWESYEFE